MPSTGSGEVLGPFGPEQNMSFAPQSVGYTSMRSI